MKVVNVYMAKAPDSVDGWAGDGDVWFKVYQISAVTNGGESITFPAEGKYLIMVISDLTLTVSKSNISGHGSSISPPSRMSSVATHWWPTSFLCSHKPTSSARNATHGTSLMVLSQCSDVPHSLVGQYYHSEVDGSRADSVSSDFLCTNVYCLRV